MPTDYLEEYLANAEFYAGIVAGLPVIVAVTPGDECIWVAPSNWLSWLILTPYMASWFHNGDTPVFIYEGSYWGGLFDWIFSAKEEQS
jgi:hypothetical protein